MSIESGSVQLTLDEIPPKWARGCDDPVIRAKAGSNRYHEPDLGADKPRPLCECGHRDVEWRVWDRETADAWREPCRSCEREVSDVE